MAVFAGFYGCAMTKLVPLLGEDREVICLTQAESPAFPGNSCPVSD
jgi:hypothetical protein